MDSLCEAPRRAWPAQAESCQEGSRERSAGCSWTGSTAGRHPGRAAEGCTPRRCVSLWAAVPSELGARQPCPPGVWGQMGERQQGIWSTVNTTFSDCYYTEIQFKRHMAQSKCSTTCWKLKSTTVRATVKSGVQEVECVPACHGGAHEGPRR